MGSSSGQINSGKPCDICGDIGYAKDIVICSKCQKAREHTYCMHPNLFNVPKSWHCEACRSHNNGFPSEPYSEGRRTYLEKKMQDSFKRQKMRSAGDVSSNIADAKPATYRPHRNYVQKKVETGKVKFLPAEDVCVLSSGAKPKVPPIQGGSNSQIGSFGTNHCHVPKKTALSTSTKHFPVEKLVNKSARHPGPLTGDRLLTSTSNKHAVKHTQPIPALKSSSHYSFKSSTSENLKGVTVVTKENKRHNSEAHPSQIDRIGHVVSGARKSHSSENALSISDKHTGRVDSSLPKDYVREEKAVDAVLHTDENKTSDSEFPLKFGDEIFPNPPAVKASWRGGFEIYNFTHGHCYEFQAYSPGKVSRKAYLVSKQMPEVLQFTLHPRCEVWPDAFHMDPPSSSDIALYFWVDDFGRSKKIYDRLLELIDKEDLSIRTCLDGVELLVFTSKQLPIESQRMNKQFYLWGVFVSPRRRHSSLDYNGKQPAIGVPLHPRGKEQCDDLDAPPGFSKSANGPRFLKSTTNNGAARVPIAAPSMKISPAAPKVDNEVDTPRGFSNSPKPKKKVSWSKVLHSSEPCNDRKSNFSVQGKNLCS